MAPEWPPRFTITAEGLAALFLRKHFADRASSDHVAELAALFEHAAKAAASPSDERDAR